MIVRLTVSTQHQCHLPIYVNLYYGTPALSYVDVNMFLSYFIKSARRACQGFIVNYVMIYFHRVILACEFFITLLRKIVITCISDYKNRSLVTGTDVIFLPLGGKSRWYKMRFFSPT